MASHHFTHYWSNSTWASYRATATRGELIDYAASNMFRTRGVTASDFLYIVTVLHGTLYLLTRLQVDAICSLDEAARILGEDPEGLWPAEDYAVAAAAAPADFERVVPLAAVKQLRFVTGEEGYRELKFQSAGMLDQQTMRGVRELSSESAALLDKLLLPVRPLHLAQRRAALARLAGPEPVRLPEEVPQYRHYIEGSVEQVTINAYERSAQARRACIKHWGCACVVCGIDFAEQYGEVAAGYIHVHHLRPLASIGAEYVLDPVNELVPVCPNCHAVMHLGRDEPYTVAEVKQFLHS